jgi:antitoxin YefM
MAAPVLRAADALLSLAVATPVAVLVAVEDLESLTETCEILSDPDAMAAIAEDRSGTGELTTGQEMAAIMAKRLGRGAA